MTTTHLPPVPHELRVQIGELLDIGKEPPVIASELDIGEAQIHQVIANREHIRAKRNVGAHRAATQKLVDQIKRLGAADAGRGKWDLPRQPDHSQPQPQHGNGAGQYPRCTVLKTCSANCARCGQPISQNLHAVEPSENAPANLYHENCCPECGAEIKKGE